MTPSRLIFAIVMLLFFACKEPASDIPYLLSPSDKPKVEVLQEKDNAVGGTVYATPNASLLFDTVTIFKIRLGEAGDVVARLNERQVTDNSIFWDGVIVGDTLSSVMLNSTNKIITGRIIYNNELYRIAYVDNNLYQVAKLDHRQLMDTAKDVVAPEPLDTTATAKDLQACTDPDTEIDVLVVYTAAAETGAGGAAGIKSLIDASVASTNKAYKNSGVSQQIKLKLAQKITYTESGDSEKDVKALRNTADGVLDDVHKLRDDNKADIVVMIVEKLESKTCGIAYHQETVSAAFQANAFAVVKRSCSLANLSFAHELGHNMGARHHDEPETTPFAYCHGHTNGTNETIMSRDQNAIRTANFSNPGIKFASGKPTGVAGVSENFKVFNNTAATVSKFRCARP